MARDGPIVCCTCQLSTYAKEYGVQLSHFIGLNMMPYMFTTLRHQRPFREAALASLLTPSSGIDAVAFSEPLSSSTASEHRWPLSHEVLVKVYPLPRNFMSPRPHRRGVATPCNTHDPKGPISLQVPHAIGEHASKPGRNLGRSHAQGPAVDLVYQNEP